MKRNSHRSRRFVSRPIRKTHSNNNWTGIDKNSRTQVYSQNSPYILSRLETPPSSRPRLIRIYDVSTSRSSPKTAVDNSTNDPNFVFSSIFFPQKGWRTSSSDKAAADGAAFAGYPSGSEKEKGHPLLPRVSRTGRRVLSLKRAALTYSTGRTRVASDQFLR